MSSKRTVRGDPPPTEPAVRRQGAAPAAVDSAAMDETRPQDGAEAIDMTRLAAAPPRRVGNLELLAPLGAGGMGEVWKARDPELDRLVAVKLVAADPRVFGQEERFRREARAAAAVAHPNVAQVYFAGTHEGRLYYAMELVRGRSLAELLAEHGRLSGSRCVAWLRQACEGLAAAQQAGVVHRDVKPSNLMVEDSGRLKLVDFGLARRVEIDATLTRAGAVMGTPSYMSPEQAHGTELDHRSDIYSLGATFYHLLCGEPPFTGPSAVEVLRQHAVEPLPPLRTRHPAVPEGIAAVVERMLAKDPAARFQSYDEILAALDGRGALGTSGALAAVAPREAAATAGRRWATLGLALVTAGLVAAAVARWRAAPAVPAPGAEQRQTAAAAAAGPAALAAPRSAAARVEPLSPLAAPATARAGEAAGPAAVPPAPAAADDPRAATEATLRTLTEALIAQGRSGAPPPADVDELIARAGLDPALARDGWGSAVRLERPPLGPPVLVTMGPDRQPRTADDMVFLGGQLRAVPPRARAIGPQP